MLLSSCQESEVNMAFSAMDTAVSITCRGKDAKPASEALKQTILSCEKQFSKTDPDSDVSKINQQRSLQLSELSEETVSMIHISDQIVSLTSGAFDPSLGTLISLWGIGTKDQKVPTQDEISGALLSCGWENVALSDTAISIPNGMSLDFGAIAKGQTTDELWQVLQEYSLDGCVISLGGNVLVTGLRPDQTPWRVGISDPEKISDSIGYLTITDCAVVTSGNYERYFESDGIRYHHILDRKTGYPAESGLTSVTVISKNAAMADGFSTALFVMGAEEGMKLVEQTEDVEAIFITEDHNVICSSGIQSSFTLTETDRFTLVSSASE